MGANTLEVRDEWPLRRPNWTTFYLSGACGIGDRKGILYHAPGAHRRTPQPYDPAFPCQAGRSFLLAARSPAQDVRQTSVEQRSDVLVYSSAPLEQDTE